ncbi:hypothetical protein [Mycolicibacterium cosmeticum]|uniref:hypothetical protein n=1 Tax=Mycolicibacterium cosmeticum TaxID=258533 RepID=UPI003204D416
MQRSVRSAAKGDFVDVVCGQVVAGVGGYAVAGAPVTVLGAVGVDCGAASCTVAWFANLAAELPLVAVVVAAVVDAA